MKEEKVKAEEIVFGTGVTQLFHSDSQPWEVIKVISEKTLEIRSMRSELDSSWQPEFVAGGFAGHCVNNSEQRWNVFSDPTGVKMRIRKNKKGFWIYKGQRFSVGFARRFYDYNF